MDELVVWALYGVTIACCFLGGLAVAFDRTSAWLYRVLGGVLIAISAYTLTQAVYVGMPGLAYGFGAVLIIVALYGVTLIIKHR